MGSALPAPCDPISARIALYKEASGLPSVAEVQADSEEVMLELLRDRVFELVREMGGAVPRVAVAEIVDNLAHASFNGAVVSILDGGCTVRVSDRGPGIVDKERALQPGFTTADSRLRRLLRGVGSGLPIAVRALSPLSGSLEIADNLGGGAVVTIRVPRPEPAAPPDARDLAGSLSARQLRTLSLIVELGPVGPTELSEELGVSPSTAYRELVTLDQAGLVTSDAAGRRVVTDEGIAYLESVL